MSFWKVLFSAGIGWWMGGPLGAVIGVIIGNMIKTDVQVSSRPYAKQHEGFVASLLVLMAEVMKADGKVLKSELDYVKTHLRTLFGEEQTAQALIVLRDIIKKDIPVIEVCHQIRVNLDYSSRIQLLHLLFGLAKADGSIVQVEIDLIQQMSVTLGISSPDYESVLNMFYETAEAYYKVLEIEPSASDEEVKKAYRRMAVRFHPDKVIHLGEEFQGAAKEKFQKVSEAYEKIKKERGIK